MEGGSEPAKGAVGLVGAQEMLWWPQAGLRLTQDDPGSGPRPHISRRAEQGLGLTAGVQHPCQVPRFLHCFLP